MALKFSPNGTLDVSTDPMDLPSQQSGNDVVSGAMQRCTNLHLDHDGIASTRRGSQKVSASAMSDLLVKLLVEQGGDRYAIAGASLYLNESSIGSGYTDAEWSAILYNAYNVITQSVFATNGTDLKRITASTIAKWGIDAPEDGPSVLNFINYAYNCHVDPSGNYFTGSTSLYMYHFTQTHTGADGIQRECLYDWEVEHLDNPAIGGISPDSAMYRVMYWFELEQSSSSQYQVCYTYCRKSGDILECESNPSPWIAITPQCSILIKPVASGDTQVTHYRFYRTLANLGTMYYAGECSVAAGYFVLTTSDENLGSQLEIDHTPPPADIACLGGPAYSGCIMAGAGNLLWYSKSKQPEYWPYNYNIQVGPPQLPIIAMCMFGGQLFVANASDIWMIQGTGPDTFFPLQMSAAAGTVARQCLCPIIGKGIYHLSSEGIFLFRVGADVCVSEDNFSPIFHGETRGSMPGMNLNYKQNCWMITWRGSFYFGYPGGEDEYPKDVIRTELSSGKSVHFQYPFGIKTVTIDKTNQRLLAGCDDGYIRIIEEIAITDDDGEPVAWDLETMAFSQFRKAFPRYARYDVDFTEGEALAQGFICLNGDSMQTHNLTVPREIRKRHVATSTGDRLSVRITGSGIVDIYAAQVE